MIKNDCKYPDCPSCDRPDCDMENSDISAMLKHREKEELFERPDELDAMIKLIEDEYRKIVSQINKKR